MNDPAAPDRHESEPARGRLALGVALAAAIALAAAAEVAFGWVEPGFDHVAHLFFEQPMLARVRRPSQVPLVRGHLAVLGGLTAALALASPWLGRHARLWGSAFLVGYALRATVWVAGGNIPLVPGDSCHYLEVATSVYRGEGPVKHYVESFFLDYPAIRQGRGVLDDWATPLWAYVLAVVYRALGIEPGRDLEQTVGVAKGVSFVLSLLAMPSLYVFGRRRFDREVGLGAMAVLAVLPVHVIYAGFALRESLVALTSILAVWTLTEVWAARTLRAAWAWALVAGLCAGLAILGRNTALALMAGAGLFGLVWHVRRVGPMILWGVVMSAVIAPWALATYREYRQPFFSYTNYFEYNFSWTVHHYEKGLTRASEFYTRANAPEIVRVKVKALTIIVVTSTMILSLPLTLAALRRLRRGSGTDRLVGLLAAVLVVATLRYITDVTQVAQLGRYYLPLFALALPTAVAGLRDWKEAVGFPSRGVAWLGVSLAALLWSDPTWAYDASWLVKPHQLHWPALREAGDWIKAHPEAVPPDTARVMTWFPWELRVASDRTTVLMPRNYSPARIEEVIRQYGVTHVLWGSFEPPPHVDPETWGPYLKKVRDALGLTEGKLVHETPPGVARRFPFPVRLYRLR
jgi:hypothetical protein